MSNLYAADYAADAKRIPVWSKAPEVASRFTAWGSAPVNDQDDFEPEPEIEVAPAFDLDEERSQAFSDGYAAGIEAGRHEIEPEREAFRAFATSLASLQPEPTQGLGAMIAATVERLLVEVMGEVEMDRETLLARAQAAAALIGDETKPSVLKLNAADVSRLQGVELPVALAVDPFLAPGEMRLETGSGSIEDGPKVRLQRLRAAFERISDVK